MRRCTRRRLLKASAPALAMAAGCSAISPGSNPPTSSDASPTPADGWYIRPDTDPATVPQPLECPDDDFIRAPSHSQTIQWGNTGALTLRVSSLTASTGDEIHITLTNTASEPVDTGNRRKFTLELYTTAGWQPVRGTTHELSLMYTDEAVRHSSGEGFLWNVTLTEDWITYLGKDLEVCPALVSGRYRFVYWGLPQTEQSLAVAFDFQSTL